LKGTEGRGSKEEEGKRGREEEKRRRGEEEKGSCCPFLILVGRFGNNWQLI